MVLGQKRMNIDGCFGAETENKTVNKKDKTLGNHTQVFLSHHTQEGEGNHTVKA